jgi:hypothetical protein
MGDDLRLFLGRIDAPADVIEAVLAADIHHDGAARTRGLLDRQVNLVRATKHGTDRPHGGMHHHERSRTQTQLPQRVDQL